MSEDSGGGASMVSGGDSLVTTSEEDGKKDAPVLSQQDQGDVSGPFVGPRTYADAANGALSPAQRENSGVFEHPAKGLQNRVENEDGNTLNGEENGILNEETDSEENLVKELNARVGYINLVDSNLRSWSEDEIAKSVWDENERWCQPKHLYLVMDAIKMIFFSEDQREKVVYRKLSVGREIRAVERPRDPGARLIYTTLYLHGVPMHEPDYNVREWLNQHGVEVTSSFRFNRRPGTEIEGNSRSVVVRHRRDNTIPGFVMYRTTTCQKSKLIRIWHRGQTVWCRRCRKAGHIARLCPMRPSYPSPPENFEIPRAGTTSGTVEAMASEQETIQLAPQSQDDEGKISDSVRMQQEQMEGDGGVLVEEVESTSEVFVLANDEELVVDQATDAKTLFEQLTEQYGTNMTLFQGEKDFLSNFYISPFTIAGVQYKCTEMYLMAKKAEICQDEAVRSVVMSAKRAVDCKKRGDGLNWDTKKLGDWYVFAADRLREGTLTKFAQSSQLRLSLFRTRGTRLVEATRNSFWGCGASKDKAKGVHPSEWKGRNIFGDLLTVIRSEMIADPRYGKDVVEAKEQQRIADGFNSVIQRSDSISLAAGSYKRLRLEVGHRYPSDPVESESAAK